MSLSFKQDEGRIRRWSLQCAGILACAAAVACATRPPAVISVAGAADLQFALEDLIQRYRPPGSAVQIRAVYGSSGNFFAQIRNGAPFDVFLSADTAYPRKLTEAGIGVKDSVFFYAAGKLGVWVPASSPLDPAHALESDSVQHIAIANPDHAPYGRAAVAALRSLGLFDRVEKKLVRGESVSQAFEFVESGAAEAGIVALSLALAPRVSGKGKYWEIPVNDYPAMEQSGMVVKDSPEARSFCAWMLSPAAAAVLRKYGFAVPER